VHVDDDEDRQVPDCSFNVYGLPYTLSAALQKKVDSNNPNIFCGQLRARSTATVPPGGILSFVYAHTGSECCNGAYVSPGTTVTVYGSWMYAQCEFGTSGMSEMRTIVLYGCGGSGV
jgi:hypothetical protein